jgi:hypothetical protein
VVKRIGIALSTVFAALSVAGPVAALSNDGPAYEIFWYDDEEHTNWVGWGRPHCFPGGPGTVLVWGVNTAYEEFVQVGNCENGVLVP